MSGESGEEEATPSRALVAESASLPEGGRVHVQIAGRYVTVLRLGGVLHGIDSVCFHAGGPLGIGEIEDLNGRSCLVCPWHHYKIDVATGDKYYQAGVWENGKMRPGEWQSNGVKQRVHRVTEEEGNIYISLCTDGNVDSDGYAFNVPCGERMKPGGDNNATRTQQALGGDGRMPSGYVLLRAAAGRNNPAGQPPR